MEDNAGLILGGTALFAGAAINKGVKKVTGKSVIDMVRSGNSTSSSQPNFVSESQNQTDNDQPDNSQNNSSHNNSSNKFVSDGKGGMIENPSFKSKSIIAQTAYNIKKR